MKRVRFKLKERAQSIRKPKGRSKGRGSGGGIEGLGREDRGSTQTVLAPSSAEILGKPGQTEGPA